MGDYDLTFKRLAARRPADFARLVLQFEPASVEPIPGELPSARHEADFVARVQGPAGDLVLHIECESQTRSDLSARLLEYHVLLRAREQRPVLSAVLALRGPADAPRFEDRELRLAALDLETIVFRYRALHLRGFTARELLDLGAVGLLPLVPLTRDGVRREALEAVISKIEESAASELRPDLLTGLAVFAGIAGRRELVYSLVRSDDMQESVIYQDILAKGREKGVAEGRAEGEAKTLLRILERRFGRVSEEVRRRVSAEKSIPRLDVLVDLALSATTLAEFEAGL